MKTAQTYTKIETAVNKKVFGLSTIARNLFHSIAMLEWADNPQGWFGSMRRLHFHYVQCTDRRPRRSTQLKLALYELEAAGCVTTYQWRGGLALKIVQTAADMQRYYEAFKRGGRMARDKICAWVKRAAAAVTRRRARYSVAAAAAAKSTKGGVKRPQQAGTKALTAGQVVHQSTGEAQPQETEKNLPETRPQVGAICATRTSIKDSIDPPSLSVGGSLLSSETNVDVVEGGMDESVEQRLETPALRSPCGRAPVSAQDSAGSSCSDTETAVLAGLLPVATPPSPAAFTGNDAADGGADGDVDGDAELPCERYAPRTGTLGQVGDALGSVLDRARRAWVSRRAEGVAPASKEAGPTAQRDRTAEHKRDLLLLAIEVYGHEDLERYPGLVRAVLRKQHVSDGEAQMTRRFMRPTPEEAAELVAARRRPSCAP